jgi:hypothetical protein
MAYQIRFFLLILALVMMGYAQAFWILSSVNINIAFGTLSQTLLNTYYLMLTNLPANEDVDSSHNPTMLYTLIIIFTLIVTILMLNLLIAIMSDAYGKIRDNGLAQWRYEQATIILEENRSAPNGPYQPYVHVLRPSQIDNDDVIPKKHGPGFEEIVDKVRRLEKTIETMKHSVKEKSSSLSYGVSESGRYKPSSDADRYLERRGSGAGSIRTQIDDRGVF